MLIEEETCSDADDSDFPDVNFEGVKKVRNVEVEQSAGPSSSTSLKMGNSQAEATESTALSKICIQVSALCFIVIYLH